MRMESQAHLQGILNQQQLKRVAMKETMVRSTLIKLRLKVKKQKSKRMANRNLRGAEDKEVTWTILRLR